MSSDKAPSPKKVRSPKSESKSKAKTPPAPTSMTFKERLIWLVKKPLFWLALVVLIVVIALLASKTKSTPSCSTGQVYDSSCGKCRPICPSEAPKYDCSNNVCICEDGKTFCGGVCCNNDLCQKHGEQSICCSEEQKCLINGTLTCCPEGTICVNGQCKVVCGKDETGKPNMCDDGDTCIVVNGISPAAAIRIKGDAIVKGDKAVVNGSEAFICVPKAGQCEFANEQAAPLIQQNYYPCFNLPKTDKDTGIGYCSSDGTTEAKHNCFNEYKDEASCETNGCVWRDLLTVAGKPASAPGALDDGLHLLSQEINMLTEGHQGYYCDPSPGSGSYARVVSAPQESGICDWQNCWSHLAGENVIDIKWDDVTKQCTAIQSCNSSTGMTNQVVTDKGTRVANPSTSNQLPSSAITGFPNCGEVGSACPLVDQSVMTCYQPDGTLRKPVTWTGFGSGPNFKCLQDIEGNGSYLSMIDCYRANCDVASGGVNVGPNAQACCGTSGYKIIQGLECDGKCYQPPYIGGDDPPFGPSTSIDVCDDTLSEPQRKAACGPSWRPECRTTGVFSSHYHSECNSDVALSATDVASSRTFCQCYADGKDGADPSKKGRWYKANIPEVEYQYDNGAASSGDKEFFGCKFAQNSSTCVK